MIQKYRGRKWAENALVNAVIEYLSYPNVAESYNEYAHVLREREINALFKAVRPPHGDIRLTYPSPQDALSILAFQASIHEPEFGGLLYVLSDRTRKQFWHGAAGFKADKPAAIWKGFPFVGMYRWIKNDPVKRAALERARLEGRERAAARAKAKAEKVAKGVRGDKRVLDEVEEEDEVMGEDNEDMGAEGVGAALQTPLKEDKAQ